jgi:hypothetical protein
MVDLKAYVYRVWPKIDKQQDRVYIAIVQEPVDEDYLLRHFGSGRYLIMIKDRGKLLRKHTVSVHSQAFPPRVDESEVIADPANDAFFQAVPRSDIGGVGCRGFVFRVRCHRSGASALSPSTEIEYGRPATSSTCATPNPDHPP